MAVSGNADFNPALYSIARRALRLVGAIEDSETPTAAMADDAMFACNSMVTEWQAMGIHVWTEEEAILFLQANQNRYLIPGAHTSSASDWVNGELALNAAAGASSITLEDATGIADNDAIGILLDDGSMQFTTVNGAPVADVVTLDNVLTGAASAQNAVIAYTTVIGRPLLIPKARLYYYGGTPQGGNEIPMIVLSRQEYMDLPNKENTGTPTQFFYTPQRDVGELYVWPSPAQAQWGVRFTWYRPIMDFDTLANTADLPREWINAMTWNLAKEIGVEYGIPAARWQIILTQAAEKLEMVQGYDRESQPIQFGQAYDSTRRWG